MDIGSFIKHFQAAIDRFFGIPPQTSAPIIISISIFVFGFVFTELIKGIGRINKRKITRKIFFHNLSNLSSQIRAQAESYRKFSDGFKFRSAAEGGQYDIRRIELYQITVIKQIGYDNLFSAFFVGVENTVLFRPWRKKRIKAFNTIWASIEKAKAWHKITLSQQTILIDNLNTVNLKRQEALQQYFEFIQPRLFNAGLDNEIKNSILGDYLFEVSAIIARWQKLQNKSNPVIFQEQLVTPIMQIDEKFKLKVNETITSSIHLEKASEKYFEMRRLFKGCSELFFQQSLSFKMYSNLIRISQNRLS